MLVDNAGAGQTKTETALTKKRILIVVTFANVAGAQIAALRLARGLKQRGHDPRVVFLYQQVEIKDPYHPYEVILPRDRPGFKGYLQILITMIKIVRNSKPDVVLTFLPLAHAVGQGAALLGRVRRRVAAHRMPINTAQRILRMTDLVYAWLGVYTNVTAVSRSVMQTCEAYPRWLKKRAKVIYNGLVDWNTSSLSQQEARARFAIPNSPLILVTVGRFVPQKNYRLLLRIMCELEDAIVVVAGDGPLREAIEREIDELGLRKRVLLLGNLEREEIPHLLAACDLFIQTSKYEGNSNSMLEALASGSVIVAHDIPEQREVMADEGSCRVAGVLVPMDDLEVWVAEIRRLAEDSTLRQRVRQLAMQRAKQFNYKQMIDEYEKIVASDL
ncbi:MAG: glycosyltransferase family 4 protein [Pseudoruegeria sp.]